MTFINFIFENVCLRCWIRKLKVEIGDWDFGFYIKNKDLGLGIGNWYWGVWIKIGD